MDRQRIWFTQIGITVYSRSNIERYQAMNGMSDQEFNVLKATGKKIINILVEDQVPALVAITCLERLLDEMYRTRGLERANQH